MTHMVSTKSSHLRHLLLVSLGQEQIGTLVKQAREDADLSQQQLADRIGLRHAQSISRYERGLTEVPTKQLRRIAEVTRKPISFFVGEPGGLQPSDRERLAVAVDQIGQVGPQLVELARELVATQVAIQSSQDQLRRLAAELLAELRSAEAERRPLRSE
jgi:transcriptional regulator with XRE-family HTH domain